MSDFETKYYGIWDSQHPQDDILNKLAEEYHNRTEAYDRLICTGPIRNDSIMPANSKEHVWINRNAKEVYNELLIKASSIGVTPKQWQRAVTNHKK